MIKKKIKANTKVLAIEIPDEWINKELEVIIKPIYKETKIERMADVISQLFLQPLESQIFYPATRKEIYEK
jgi:hypothetical protein